MKRIGLGLCAILLSSCTATSSYSSKRYSDDFTVQSCEQPPREFYESKVSMDRLKRLYQASLRLSTIIGSVENNYEKYDISESEMIVYRDVAGFKDKIQHRLFNVWNNESDNVQQVPFKVLKKIRDQESRQPYCVLNKFMADAIPHAVRLFATEAWHYSDLLYSEGGKANWVSDDKLMIYLFDKYNLFNRE